jgi:hypothetical protein
MYDSLILVINTKKLTESLASKNNTKCIHCPSLPLLLQGYLPFVRMSQNSLVPEGKGEAHFLVSGADKLIKWSEGDCVCCLIFSAHN